MIADLIFQGWVWGLAYVVCVVLAVAIFAGLEGDPESFPLDYPVGDGE